MVTPWPKKNRPLSTLISLLYSTKKRGAILEFSNRNVFEINSIQCLYPTKRPNAQTPPKKNRLCTQSLLWITKQQLGGLERNGGIAGAIAAIRHPEIRTPSPDGETHGKKPWEKKNMVLLRIYKKKMAEKNDPHNQILSLWNPEWWCWHCFWSAYYNCYQVETSKIHYLNQTNCFLVASVLNMHMIHLMRSRVEVRLATCYDKNTASTAKQSNWWAACKVNPRNPGWSEN